MVFANFVYRQDGINKVYRAGKVAVDVFIYDDGRYQVTSVKYKGSGRWTDAVLPKGGMVFDDRDELTTRLKVGTDRKAVKWEL